MIVIVDYQCGNLFSVQKALKRLNLLSISSNYPKDIELADKIILPGVGNFGSGMRNLAKNNLIDILSEKNIGQENSCARYMFRYAIVNKL